MSYSLWPNGLQHTRLPCPSLSPGFCSNSCPLSLWCHPAISFSVSPSPPAFNHSQHQDLFQWVDFQHLMVKVLELQLQHQSVLPMNILSWFPLGMTGLTSLQSKGLSRVIFSTTIRKHQFFSAQPFFMVQLSHPYMTTGKIIALTVWTFVYKVMPLLFNMLSRFVIAFLPRIKQFLILWLQLPSAVILVPLPPK